MRSLLIHPSLPPIAQLSPRQPPNQHPSTSACIPLPCYVLINCINIHTTDMNKKDLNTIFSRHKIMAAIKESCRLRYFFFLSSFYPSFPPKEWQLQWCHRWESWLRMRAVTALILPVTVAFYFPNYHLRFLFLLFTAGCVTFADFCAFPVLHLCDEIIVPAIQKPYLDVFYLLYYLSNTVLDRFSTVTR